MGGIVGDFIDSVGDFIDGITDTIDDFLDQFEQVLDELLDELVAALLKPFKTEYVNVVGTSVSRIVPDGLINNTLTLAAIAATLENHNLADFLGRSQLTNFTIRAERAYNYAAREYIHGLPYADIQPNLVGADTFFPFIYFRFNKVSEFTGEYKNTPAYKESSTVKYCKHLGIDYSSLLDSLNSNSGIGDVEQAIMVMAVPANTQNKIEIEYLFKFFDAVRTTDSDPSMSINIQDRRFSMVLTASNVDRADVVLNTGSVGTYSMEFVTLALSRDVADSEGNITTVSASGHKHVYRLQVTETHCQEISVHGMELAYNIFGGLAHVADSNDGELLIPLHYDISKTLSTKDGETLYARSLHTIVNVHQIVALKWYQQDWFGIILTIVGIILIIIGMYTQNAAAIKGGATLLGAAYAVLVYLIKMYIIGIILGYIAKELVKEFGLEWTFLIVLVAAYYSQNTEVFVMYIGAMTPLLMLGLVTIPIQAAAELEYEEIQDTSAALSSLNSLQQAAYDKQREEDIKDAQLDEIGRRIHIALFKGTPTQYYELKTTTDPGQQSIQLIRHYVDLALLLPNMPISVRSFT